MLGVGQPFPLFRLRGTVSSNLQTAFQDINSGDYIGKWLVIFFWPKDFTFVCPTEIAEFGNLNSEFEKRDAKILGISVDSEFVHLAWRQQNRELNNLPFPMLTDVKRDLSIALDILDPKEGVVQRATYIVDPEAIIRFVMVTDLNVGRNIKEVLRVLDALQTGELVPCNWEKGQGALQVT